MRPAKLKNSVLGILIFLMSLSACQPAQAVEPTHTLAPTTSPSLPTPTAEPPSVTPSPTPTDSTSEKNSRTQYHFDLNLNYPASSLTTIEIIGYTNTTGGTLTQLPLVIPPAQQTGVFSLISLTDSQTQETIPFTFEG